MDHRSGPALAVRVAAMAGVTAIVMMLLAVPARAAASIDAKAPSMSFLEVPSRGPIALALSASATFDPGTAHAFASFVICKDKATSPCVAITASPIGGPKNWDAQKTAAVDLVSGLWYTVEARWEGFGLAWTGVVGHSIKTFFRVPQLTDSVKDNLKSAVISAVGGVVVFCGAILVADAFGGPPVGAVVAKQLGPICLVNLTGAVGAGVPLLFDPPDGEYGKVAVPAPVLPPAPAPPVCDPPDAACTQLVAQMAEYEATLRDSAGLWVALAKTTNRMTTAGQAGDFASVNLQVSSARVLFGMVSDAIETERAAARKVAQSLTANGLRLTVTPAQVDTVLGDGSWIAGKVPDAQPALNSMGLDQAAVMSLLRQGHDLGTAAIPNVNDLATVLNAPVSVTEMRRWSAGLTAADLAAVVTALAATGEVRSGVNGPLAAALRAGCVNDASRQRELAIVSAVSDSYLKRFLVAGIQAQAPAPSGEPSSSDCPTGPGGSTAASPTISAGRPKVTPLAGSLIGGGGFEAGDGIPDQRNQGYATFPATGPVTGTATPTLGPWRIAAGCLDLVYDSPAALDGSQFIDLNGNCDTSGVIEQTVHTTKGHRYEVTAALAGNAHGDPAVKRLRVAFGTKTQEFTFDTTDHRPDNLGWATHTFVATADGDTTVLRFTSLTTGIRGPLLDHVSAVDLGRADGGHSLRWLWLLVGLLALAAVIVLLVLRRRSTARSAHVS